MICSKRGFSSHFLPQVQVLISEMLQATVEAYQLYGLNAATSSCVSGLTSSLWDFRGMVKAGMVVYTDWGTRETRKAENQAVGAMLSERAVLFRPVLV